MRLAPTVLAMLLLAGCAGGVRVRYEQPGNPPDRDPQVAREDRSPHAKHPPLQIPRGHLPRVGSCRIWLPGTPPGHQPPPGDCARLAGEVPPGAWLVYRSANDPEHVDVCVYGTARQDVPVEIQVYVVATGEFVRTKPRG
jgi:hypothetical protein